MFICISKLQVSFLFTNDRYGNLPNDGSSSNYTAKCNVACGCDLKQYTPVCGADAYTYYSPCHAGCEEFTGVTETSLVCDGCQINSKINCNHTLNSVRYLDTVYTLPNLDVSKRLIISF